MILERLRAAGEAKGGTRGCIVRGWALEAGRGDAPEAGWPATMTTTIEPTAQTLAGVEIFSRLGQAERDAIARRCRGRRYLAGHEILHHRDTGDDVHFLVSGRVRATIFSASGKEVAFRDLGPGEIFGELSAIDHQPRSANVIALEESSVLSMSSAAFLTSMREYPEVAIALMSNLTALVRHLSERVVEFSTLGVNNRIHAELLRLANAGKPVGAKVEIESLPTHAEIANRISTHREAVTKEINRLASQGLLEKRRGALVIRDVGKLAEMVSDVKR